MSERYTRLNELPENLYLDGAPVLIVAGALLKDNKTGSVLAQLKLQNLHGFPVTACKVHVLAFDPSGKELQGVDSHSFLDLTAVRGEYFGSKSAIVLPDSTTRRVSVSVTQVVFADGTVWEHDPAPWVQPKLERRKIEDVFTDRELQKQFSIEIGGPDSTPKGMYAPERQGSLTMCACGALNLTNDEKCRACDRVLATVFAAMDPETLMKNKDERLAHEEAERIEREKHEEEQRLEREKHEEEQRLERKRKAEDAKKKRIKTTSITAAILLLAVAVTLLVTQVVIPANKYKAAEALLTERNYDAAIIAFEALGDYKDSAHRAEDVPYVCADDLFSDGDYDGALEAFRKLKDYSDAPERVNEILQIKYELAQELMASGKYDLAIDAFTEIKDYSDSRTRINEANYCMADNALSAGEYDQAINIFTELRDYSDSETRLLDAKYMKACALLEGGSYSEAISLFSEFGNYKDSHDMLLESKYQFAASQFRDGALKDARAGFEDLSKLNYKDSAAQLNSVFDSLYDNAAVLVERAKYNEAYKEFKELSGFSDSNDRMEQIYNIITDKAFKTLQQKDFNSAYNLFVAVKNTYPSIIGTRLDDAILYTDVKCLDFNNGHKYNLADIYDKIDLIKNEDYKQELLKLPQMKMILQLNGTWTFAYKFSFANGRIEGSETCVFYQSGYYYLGLEEDSYFLSRFSDITANQFALATINGPRNYYKRVDG